MRLAGGFFRDKTPPRRLMLAASPLLTLSQFFANSQDPTTGFAAMQPRLDPADSLRAILSSMGWERHPQAVPILVVLALAFLRDEIAEHRPFRRFGHRVALALIFVAMSPGAPTRATGRAWAGSPFSWLSSQPSGTSSCRASWNGRRAVERSRIPESPTRNSDRSSPRLAREITRRSSAAEFGLGS